MITLTQDALIRIRHRMLPGPSLEEGFDMIHRRGLRIQRLHEFWLKLLNPQYNWAGHTWRPNFWIIAGMMDAAQQGFKLGAGMP